MSIKEISDYKREIINTKKQKLKDYKNALNYMQQVFNSIPTNDVTEINKADTNMNKYK